MDIITPKFQPVFLTRSFVKNEDKVRAMKFEPIEINFSLRILLTTPINLLISYTLEIKVDHP